MTAPETTLEQRLVMAAEKAGPDPRAVVIAVLRELDSTVNDFADDGEVWPEENELAELADTIEKGPR